MHKRTPTHLPLHITVRAHSHLKWEGLKNWTAHITPPPPTTTINRDRQTVRERQAGATAHEEETVCGLTSGGVMLWSRYKGKPHDCSGLSVSSVSLYLSAVWQTGSETHTHTHTHTHRQRRAELTDARHTLQAQTAVEPRRPRARPLTLCLLRMKREDFITSCRPRLHPSSLPPPKSSLPASPPPSLPPRFPSTLPASSTLQGLSQAKRGEADCQRKPPIPPPARQRCALHTERGGQREMRKEMKRQRDGGIQHMV